MSGLLNYEIISNSDSKEWVVFIHGAGGSTKTWSFQTRDFSKYYNLLLIDLRDHGGSKNMNPNQKHYSFDLISRDIKNVMDNLGIDKAHFMTLSFGSVIIQDFAIRYESLVDKIVMAGGIFKGTWAIRAFVLLARFMNLFLSYPSMYRLFSYALMPKASHQVGRRLYQRQARKLTNEEYLKWIGLYGEFFKLLRSFFRQVLEKPTLVIMGNEDYVFLKGAKQFLKHQPMASMVNMIGVGHICNIEQPGTFNRKALAFLQS